MKTGFIIIGFLRTSWVANGKWNLPNTETAILHPSLFRFQNVTSCLPQIFRGVDKMCRKNTSSLYNIASSHDQITCKFTWQVMVMLHITGIRDNQRSFLAQPEIILAILKYSSFTVYPFPQDQGCRWGGSGVSLRGLSGGYGSLHWWSRRWKRRICRRLCLFPGWGRRWRTL